jgi:hypothetical protein
LPDTQGNLSRFGRHISNGVGADLHGLVVRKSSGNQDTLLRQVSRECRKRDAGDTWLTSKRLN